MNNYDSAATMIIDLMRIFTRSETAIIGWPSEVVSLAQECLIESGLKLVFENGGSSGRCRVVDVAKVGL